MLIPQETPCGACGHSRGDHEIDLSAGGIERCKRCGCTATNLESRWVWDPSGPPRPFDWTRALVTFVLQLDEGDGFFTDTIEQWQPGYALMPGERDELREVESIVRQLWERYAPKKPPLANFHAANVEEENAAVDRYWDEISEFRLVLLRLAVGDEWRSHFPRAEHRKIDRARTIIISHGGDRAV